MRQQTKSSVVGVTVATLALALGCGSSDGESDQPEPLSPEELAALCGPGWVEACERQDCDATSELWQDCRQNGWSGYEPAQSCPVSSGYLGDDAALCPPDPADGFQAHFGPLDYTDDDELLRHTIQPGENRLECVYLEMPNDDDRFLGYFAGSVRPGAHHSQMKFVLEEPTGSSAAEPCNPIVGEFVHIGQTNQFHVPDLGVPNPSPGEDFGGGLDFQGSALELTPRRIMAVELHYINTTSEPMLREGWFNFYYQKPEEVRSVVTALSLLGLGIQVPPRTTANIRRSCAAPSPRFVTHLQGHTHEGTQRFSIWVHRAATGEMEQVYENYDPLEPVLLSYNSIVQNREWDRAARHAGGASGELFLDEGDSIVWECEIENSGDAVVSDGGPAAGQQMCYVFGNFIPDGPAPEGNWGCLESEASTL